MKVWIYILLLIFIQCTSVHHIVDVKETNINIADTEEASSIAKIIAPYKLQLDEEMNTVIGFCDKTLTKERPESTLGNWFCDVLASSAPKFFDQSPDFVVQNFGGLRIPNITKGEVTKRNIYELMPFDNLFVLVALEYKELSQFLNQMARSGGWPQSKDLRYTIVDEKATDVTIKGKLIDKNKTYWVGMPDYIANGGDNAFYLSDNPRLDKGIFLRDAIINQVIENTGNGKSIHAELDNRIMTN